MAIGSLATEVSVDQRLVAYSSVAHMGLVPLGIFTHIMEGLVGAVFLKCPTYVLLSYIA